MPSAWRNVPNILVREISLNIRHIYLFIILIDIQHDLGLSTTLCIYILYLILFVLVIDLEPSLRSIWIVPS